MKPPIAKQVPTTRVRHDDKVVDEYAWLLDRDDPDTTAYLDAENAYCESETAHLADLRKEIFTEIKTRTQETDLSVPAREGDWWYYTRTIQGQQYPLHCRGRTEDGSDEQLLIDQNQLAGDSDYFAIGVFDVSPDGLRLAYATDHAGSESYTLRFRDLDSGADLTDEVTGVYYGGAWSADASVFFYTTHDDAMRPNRVWRHRIGTAQADDEVVYEDNDERFFVSVGLSRSKAYIFFGSGSMVTSEMSFVPADDPFAALTVIEPRRQGIEYHVDHHGDRFLVRHNDGAPNFMLVSAPVATPGHAHWQPLLPHRDDTRLVYLDAFRDHVVVTLRRNGLRVLRVFPLQDSGFGNPHDIEFPDEIYTVRGNNNPEFDTATYRLSYTSMVTPQSIYDYQLEERELTLKKQTPVLGDVDLGDYETARDWAVAPDGTRIPISLAWRKDTPRTGALLYGYGSYEISMDPEFSIPRLSLLDRGVVYAIAHIRGGGEMGRLWYEDGKLLAKRNTFTDFVACADRLVEAGWASYERIVARGGSAGGLMMGAVANLAPEKFGGVLAHVPFVDNLNTILDPSLPLTVIEWEEWGNPVDSAEVYHYLKSYAPYENVVAQDYPPIFATAGLNDPRVGYHEPAKWVARLRANRTGTTQLLLKTEMGAGHGGKSGRYDAWRDEALYLAWALDRLAPTR